MKKLLVFFCSLFWMPICLGQSIQVSELKCEYKVDPSGIQVKSPRLSWILKSKQRNVMQSAYQIIVADDAALLKDNTGNVWDSGRINSKSSIQVAYDGKPLESTKTYFWKVRVWDSSNSASEWSKPSSWQMGLLFAKDWTGAKWVAYEKLADSNVNVLPSSLKKDTFWGNNTLPLFRKSFTINKSIKKATVFIAGLGHFELNLNGRKVGNNFLDAGWTKYDKEALYVSFDLTKELKAGENAFGVMVGNGFYYIPPVKGRYRKQKVAFGYPKMICRLLIEYNDGTSENIVSDRSWKTSPGPITFSSIYGGEDYDANLEQEGWDSPGFNDKTWKQVLIVDGPPQLHSQMAEPLKVMETFSPKEVKKLGSGEWVYDLGQNSSGIIEITVKGNKGDTIRIIPAELLNADGSVNQKPTGSPFYFQYILKGKGKETWRPQFTYYGFRYLQIKGGALRGEAKANQIRILELKGLHTRNSASTVGEFSSSNNLFNRTDELIDWAIKSNMVSLFTDCPHREKLGWLEETHLMGASVKYNYEIANLCRKIINDMRNSQTADGLVPEIAPEYVKFEWGGDMFRDSPEWGSASILLPWYLYKWYGDDRVLKESYSMMERYTGYLQTKAKDNILYQGLGDWYDLGPNPPGVSQLTPMGVTGTAIYYYDLLILSRVAELLGKPHDVVKYSKLAAIVKQAFNDKFFNKITNQYASGSQTANAMAVYMNLVEPDNKAEVVDNIIKDIRSRNNSLTAGDIGYRYLLRVLEQEGRSDVIFEMNNRTDVPGYGYQLEKGATALTESWAALPTVSNNHFMLGHLMEWFYSGLGGIRAAHDAVGFSKIIIHPEPVGDIQFVKTNYKSPYGLITSDWKKGQDSFELDVEIPANTDALVYLPAGQLDTIREGNSILSGIGGLKVSEYKNGRAIIKVGSGRYRFKVSTSSLSK